MVEKMTISNDPHAAREANKYDKPIPSREFITQHLRDRSGPATLRQLSFELALFDLDEVEGLRRRLRAMERDGQLISDRKGAYGAVSKMDLILGRIIGHRDGFGFLKPDNGSEDLYLHHRQMRTVLDGDKALVRLIGVDRKGRPEATIVEVTERNTQQVVGRFYNESGVCFVRPDNQRINQDVLIASDSVLQAKAGQYVVVDIIQQPTKRSQPIGHVAEILGEHMAPGMEIDVAIRNHGIPHEWPAETLAQAKTLAPEVMEADKADRVDLRKLPFVTIDGEDARDFDDAVYCRKKRLGGWRLYVAIADVSHYVRPDTALDQEAHRRATSVYFPERVVPMLPEAISNGLCSLNPRVDRLVMVCEMTVSAKGKLSGYRFYEGLIYSHARLTYTQVGAMLDPRDPACHNERQAHAKLCQPIDELQHLYKALRKARQERGAIDFETQETRIIFGEGRKIDQIVPVVRNDAHKLIEECMLCANVSTAKFLAKHKLTSLYRVHKGPKPTKLENLRSYLGELGLKLPGGVDPRPEDYQALLQQVQDRPEAGLVQTVLLRSLSQAVYTPDNEGHFGLGYDAYAHFTSPIRRYPDLLVHRAIRSVIQSQQSSRYVKRINNTITQPAQAWYPYATEQVAVLGEHCSMAERRADEASWEVTGWLKCEYMQGHIGDQFRGTINAVTSFGIFVELDDVYVEGLVHISALPGDYYHFDQAKNRLQGERTRRSFRLGDSLQVKVVRVDLDEKKIDFELVETGAKGKGGKSGKGSASKRRKKR
ncbi:MAG: ribonuclease R [Gammaproteobacteria bacterium]|nr:ribonuclease R [Gammaproteobacteria bacterium]